MRVINITLSFSDAIVASALEWMKKEYIPLMQACKEIENVSLFVIEAQQGADECYALQIRFTDDAHYQTFASKYQSDFEMALFAKFSNQMGMFKTVLTSI